jgi:hypothetical protein
MIARLVSKNHWTNSASSKSRKSAARGMLPCNMSLTDMSVEEWDLGECPYLTGTSLLVDGGMMAGL